MEVLIEEFSSSLDTFSIYTLFREKNSIFLDSALRENNLGDYSFIGVNPFLTFKSYDNNVWINGDLSIEEPFNALEKLMNKYKITNDNSIPFLSGAIGYFSYDMGRTLEKLPTTAKEDVKIPHSYFVFYDNIIIFDHKNNKNYVTALGVKEPKKQSLCNILQRIKEGKQVVYEEIINKTEKCLKSNFSKNSYLGAVETFREYIRSGDIYISNLTQRFSCHCNRPSYEIYKDLRIINRAPFAAFMELEGFEVISSSPERFMKIYNRKVETRPIKGTRPRGKDKLEDEKNKIELINSEKDKSELLMIVDLERNDLSKVCKNNSVNVTELFVIEKYATVFHLVSTIEGTLRDDVSSIECIKQCYPGGSITGAPKIRAMEVIEEVEELRRNIYTGAIGYFDYRGNSDFNIVIRTILKEDDIAYFGVGGGITFESNKEDEYEETLHKAKALIKVLQ